MPNWCTNRLYVEGDSQVIARLLSSIEGSDSEFDFNKVIAYPEKYAVLDNESTMYAGYNNGGYDWCITNWGTKWNAVEVSVGVGENWVSILFDTAWSPSLPVTDALATAYPELRFTHDYEEAGNDFSGKIIWENGSMISNEEGEYGEYGELSDEFDEQEVEDETD